MNVYPEDLYIRSNGLPPVVSRLCCTASRFSTALIRQFLCNSNGRHIDI